MSDDTFPENPLCEETYASFRIASESLVPEEVTRATGITPRFAVQKGDRPKVGAPYRTGIWIVGTKDESRSTNLEAHIVLLLDRLEPVADAIREIQERFGARMDFFCYYLQKRGHGGPGFSPSTLGRIAALDAKLDLDIYGPFREDERS